MGSELRITQHGAVRAEQRLGLLLSSFERLAEKALAEGVPHAATAGKLRAFLDGKAAAHPTSNIHLFADQVFVFAGTTLVTVYPIPGPLRADWARQRAKHKRKEAARG